MDCKTAETEIDAEKAKKKFEKFIKTYYGKKCPDYEEGCIICEVWREWEKLKEMME